MLCDGAHTDGPTYVFLSVTEPVKNGPFYVHWLVPTLLIDWLAG
jgi:hypothetical protein